jgi:hypothetical protein
MCRGVFPNDILQFARKGWAIHAPNQSDWIHKAESYMRRCQFLTYHKIPEHCMESEGSSPCSQEPHSSVPTSPIHIYNINLFTVQDLRFSRRWLWMMASSGLLRRVALVRTDVSEELSASFIRVTRIGELGTTLDITGNRRTLRRNINRLSYSTALLLPEKMLLSRTISNRFLFVVWISN